MDKLILITCDNCGIETEECDVTHTQDGYVCLHCFDNDYITCDNCHDYVNKNDLTDRNNGDSICSACEDLYYSDCDWCGHSVLCDTLQEVYGCGSNVCRSCWNNNVTYCDNCEYSFNSDEIHNGYCVDCNEDRHMGGEYNYNYNFTYFKTLREPRYNGNLLYFGIELEVGCEDNVNFSNILGDYTPRIVMLTDDCSIYNNEIEYGVELVSHPATFNWLNENRNIWNDILRRFRRNGIQSFTTETCGIHIHLSKNAFTHSHMYNFLKMIYEYPKFTKFISQRDSMDRWCSLKNEADPEAIAKKADDKRSWEKYTAVNLIHPASVEVRIFRGNLNERSFYKNIQYLHSLFMYTKECPRNDSGLTIENYLQYVSIHKKQYKDLYEWLDERGKLNETVI